MAHSVYIWNFHTNQVNKLTKFNEFNICSGLKWNKENEELAIGTLSGEIEVWDFTKRKIKWKFMIHNERVGALSFYGNLLLTGSRDWSIFLNDVR